MSQPIPTRIQRFLNVLPHEMGQVSAHEAEIQIGLELLEGLEILRDLYHEPGTAVSIQRAIERWHEMVLYRLTHLQSSSP